jgi:cobaltochelatase CobN
LFDEFAEAQALDPRRARAIAALILEQGRDSGLLKECAADDKPPEDALVALDAWLCDLKEMRIGDGLHVFGRSPEGADGFALPSPVGEGMTSALDTNPDAEGCGERVAACGAAESLGLLRALGGRFVPPGPAGAPARGRLDVLPTGRNLYAIDPRSAPTRNAWEIGRRAAEEICKRYAQDHGEWPKRIVLDLWGSATMRTGGDDLAQAFALIGCRPTWDAASTRVNGFEVLPLAMLGRSRVDVTLRISGLFRDVFPSQIALFAAAVRAVAALEESAEDNPLAGLQSAGGEWATRSELAETYLAATSHAYDGEGDAREAAAEFRTRVAGAEAFVHAQDLPGQDALDADAFAEHEGGFAAAAAETGANPALYHLDSTIPGAPKIRTLGQEIARSLRGRAANPRWLQGQMRHGHRGAAEIAQSLDNLFCFAALTDAVESAQFDLMFDATLGDDSVRAFLVGANRQAACHMANIFEQAAGRGFWLSRRNSSARILASVLQEAA